MPHLTDAHDRTDAGTKKKKKVVVKKKAPPIPVPSLEAAYTPAPPKPARRPQPKKPSRPTLMDRKTRRERHLPQEFEYLAPEDFALPVGRKRGESGRRIEKFNQAKERERREAARAARALEKQEQQERRATVRKLGKKARDIIGKDRLNEYIRNGGDGGLDLGDIVGAIGKGALALDRRFREDPLSPAKDIYSAVDWWINKAPEAVLGKHTGKGYEGGAAGAWDAMSTQEQIDTIVGGKSLANVIQGQGLTPGNIARAIGLAMMAPIPFGKGLPSLSSVLLRAGFSAKEVKVMLQTGEGLREALAAAKQPVRPIARARKALSGASAAAPRVSKLRPIVPEDAAAVRTWKPEAQRVGNEVLAHTKAPAVRAPGVNPIVTAALTDDAGNLRAVLAYEKVGDYLYVSNLAGAGRGSGRAAMKEIAAIASDSNLGVKLTSQDLDSHAFYGKIGMRQVGKRDFEWSAEEARAYALNEVEPDFVRLYRGERPGTVEGQGGRSGGEWFTTDLDFASQYGPVRYVDVPKEEASKHLQGRLKHYGVDEFDPRSGSEFTLPPEWVAQAKPLSSADEAPATLFEMPEEGPVPEVFRFTRDEAEELPTVPGIWYHGTTAAAADEIEATGVLRVGERSEPRGAWLTSNPVHAAQFGDTVIMVPDSMIPAEAERISAFGGMISSPVDIPLARAAAEAVPEAKPISAASHSIAAEIHASGLPLPPELSTPEQLARAIEDVFELAREGELGKDWYKIAAAQVMRVADHTGRPPQQIAQLFAIFSQAADTVANATFVFDASRQFEKFNDLFSGRFPVRQSPEALAVLQGGQWEGRKRSSFYANILRHIPGMEEEYAAVIKAMAESRGAPITHPVTVDRWVVRMFRPGVKKDVPEKFYDTFETLMQRMGQELGWEPEQIQAAAWVSMKTRGLKAELAKKGRKTVRHIAGGEDAFKFGVDRQLELESQGTLFKGLETTPQARRLANQVNRKWGGFTVNRDMTPVPETGYSVTYSLTEEAYPLHKIKAADIEQFKERYRALLRDSRNKIGGFSDDQNPTGDGTDLSYLSVTRHFPSDSAQSRAAAVRFGRAQGQETVYEYKTGDGIRTGLTREQQREIIQGLDPSQTKGGPVQDYLPPTSAETEYRRYLDQLVRASGKGKKGVTPKQRADMEEEMIKYGGRYHDDPYFDEFWRLKAAANPTSDDIPFGEAGFFRPGAFREKAPYRTLRYKDKTEYMQGARSAVTRALIERPADWASAKLATEEGKAYALVNKLLPTASAKARVSKEAGRKQLFEAARAQARMMNFVQDLPKEGSPEDIAHFFWAQLPEAERNAAGLTRVREAMADAIDEIASGQALENITSQIDAVKAQLAATQDLALLRELEDLRVLASDLPRRVEDLSVAIARLDRVIAKPPKLDPKIIEAVRGLSQERRGILVRAGRLEPEVADAREGLMSRWLGLEPTGEEVYIGHRLGKVRGAQPSLLPVSPGVGRPRVPEGVGSRNRLVLARSGRMNPTTHVAAEDWRAAQTYENALIARDDLSLMSDPFTGRLPEKHLILNPKGRVIPRHMKVMTSVDDLDDEEIRVAAQEITDGFLADEGGMEALIAAAAEEGVDWSDLRIVHEDVVKRYYGQFTPASGSTKIGKAYDAAVDFTAASIVFARVGYIPKNIAQNLFMAVPHQGPFMLVNIPRSAQALADPELRHFLHAEVGFSGATHELGAEMRFGKTMRGLPGRTANLVGKVADDPARFSAFLHEAGAEGVISKYNPNLTAKDRAALLDLFTNPARRPQLNAIRARSVEAMADFSRLTPTQRRWARRFLIIPGWLWAGSRYPVHFAATHPGRSALLAYVLAGEPYGDRIGLPQNRPVNELFADNLPQFVEGITLPESFPIFGGKTFRTTSLSPVSTPYEIALALAGQSPDTAASYANPLAKSLWNIANRRVEYPGGSYQVGYQEAIIRNLERLLPNWTFVKQEINPDGSGYYPEDESRLGRFFRELGVVPIQVVGADARDDAKWLADAERLSGEPVPPDVIELRKTDRTYNDEYQKYQDEAGITEGGLTPQETLLVLVRTQAALHPEKAEQAKRMEVRAMAMSNDEAEAEITEGRERLGLTRYERLQRKLAEARVEARTHTGMQQAGQH